MPELSPAQRSELRARAHALKPVVSIADNGLSDTVLAEIVRSLKAHELIKIRTYGIERDDRAALMAEICAQCGCAPVQQIGNLLVVYREAQPDDAPASPRVRGPRVRATKKQREGGSGATVPAPRRTPAKAVAAPAKPARTGKSGFAGKSGTGGKTARPAPRKSDGSAPRRGATPNPPRRANNVRGR